MSTKDDDIDEDKPAPDAERTGSETTASAALGGLLASLGVTLPPLDDEAAWAERDAEVQAQIARRERDGMRGELELRARQLGEPDGGGFPARALRHAIEPRETGPVIAARRWRPVAKNILVLSGPCSIGKTVAACIPALTSSRLWHFARAADYFSSSRYDRKQRRRLIGSALVLDDLGAEVLDAAGNVLADLDELVDTFYAAERPLIITTNLGAAGMKERYPSERTISRLREAASWHEFGAAESLRPPPAAPKR